jgi:hypothetical protein
MTNEDDHPHTLRPDNIDPVKLEVAEIVQRGMAAWSERIARTALDRLSVPDRRSPATDAEGGKPQGQPPKAQRQRSDALEAISANSARRCFDTPLTTSVPAGPTLPAEQPNR